MKSSWFGPFVVVSEGELASRCQRAGYEPDQEVSDFTTGCQEPGLACWSEDDLKQELPFLLLFNQS